MVFIKFISSFVLCLILFALPRSALSDNAAPLMPSVQSIAAGSFIRGSDRKEREMAYQLDEKAYDHSRTREGRWYESEFKRGSVTIPDFSVTTTLVTNREYAVFITDTAHPAPNVSEDTWKKYGLIHPFKRTRKFAWKSGTYPAGRADHPVVLVSWHDVSAYAVWLSRKTNKHWQLPTETQWEKAARGTDGRYFPWGKDFDPAKLNSHDLGPFDTLPVGQFPLGKSPFGLLDMAGQVFEWTRDTTENGRVIVKGGSWDDQGCGVCRPAARHSRPDLLKHNLIGFRLVYEQ
ncbi:MAG: SUMF1/EgtB/PvdO family nonheme iron enzyme [Sneathiella sp.]|nr:SUMF1/EgtB/PvdO family nonheme iron enzyme [Sneathiella sp.]